AVQVESVARVHHAGRLEACLSSPRGKLSCLRWSSTPSARVLDPAQDVARDAHRRAVLIDDADIGERLSFLQLNLRDGVGERDRVADEDGSEESHAIVAERYRGLVKGGAPALVDHHGRA